MSENRRTYLGGAVGAGLVLVVLPCAAIFFGITALGGTPIVGLPILSIFGIMILFGALALVATLFARLELSDRTQALALPKGSVRAAIALALVVLFAIISVMLYQSLAKPYPIANVSEADVAAMLQERANRVIAVVPQCGPNDTPPHCPSTVHVLQPQGQEATDLAKQLLILIGTLMTSVTSFYFASRSTEEASRAREFTTTTDGTTGPQPSAPPVSPSAQSVPGSDEAAEVDGCDVPVSDPTPDDQLPAARGGVA